MYQILLYFVKLKSFHFSAADLLFVHVDWCTSKGRTKIKLKNIPTSCADPIGGERYHLIGLCNHSPGHFTTISYSPENKWWRYDDLASNTELLNENYQCTPYLLILLRKYKKNLN